MLDRKKKIILVAIIGIAVIICAIVYLVKSKEDDFTYFYDSFESDNIIENQLLNEVENINITDINKEKIVVHIAGEVLNPGVISLDEGSRIIDAINEAGGTTRTC